MEKNDKSISNAAPRADGSGPTAHLEIGSEFRTERRTIIDSEISLYAGLSGD